MDNSAGQSTNAPSGMTAGLAGRYASALFDLAVEQRQIDTVATSIDRIGQAIAASPDLRTLVASPVIARDAGERAIDAVAGELALDPLTRRFLGVLAQNRRLADLPAMVRAFAAMVTAHRGEVNAEVTTAHPLADDQLAALKAALRTRVGRDVTLATRVDPEILGGMIVRLGSQLIDGSIATRLNSFAQAMKG